MCQCRISIRAPVRHHRTALPALCRATPLVPIMIMLEEDQPPVFWSSTTLGNSCHTSQTCGSSPPAPFLHPSSARDLQTPSAYPIWYPACVDRLLSKSRNLCTAYPSNLLSGKAHVQYAGRPPSTKRQPSHSTPSIPVMRQFRTPTHRTFQLRRLNPAHLLLSQMGCCTGNDPGGAPRT